MTGATVEKKYKIAFICTGNTCRSPMAQFIMRHKLKLAGVNGVLVKSFGTKAHGSPMKDETKFVLKTLKIPYSKFTSKPLPKNLNAFDAVVCMTAEHKRALIGMAENLYTFDELFKAGDVPDPYGKDQAAYFEAAKIIYACCEKMIGYLRSGRL
ncbi:MAG: hypothetical protein ILP02_02810 [Clostridia bacterium]|nr:hypothetical protein [Clostridia bacterium]